MNDNQDNWDRLEELFHKAAELPADEVATFCARECGDDRELHEFLIELVNSVEIGDERIRDSVAALASDVASQSDLTGERLGAYRLEELLDRGGMGAVYLASRADGEFEKQVVVKILRQRLNNDEFVHHFRTERQVLANLRHPFIPALIDAGQLDDGRPYLVSEYVKGLPIDEYCDTNALSNKQRVVLFESLCVAVQHAHNNLVLHLDIKPANILIESDGTPRLLDFGIARLMGDPESGLKAFTPDYASPEQLKGEPPSAASDIYSLGVLMYQLLAGEKPFSAPRFATRQTKMADRAVLAERLRLPAAMPGVDTDLFSIVRKAMAQSTTERYRSVESLLLDLQHYRNHRPVQARAGTYRYRLGKYLRRHWVGLTLTVAIIALSVGLGLREFQLRTEAQLAYARADQEAETLRQVATFMTDLFEVSDPGETRGNTVTARELLDRGSERIATELSDQPEIAAKMMRIMGTVYIKLGLFEQAAGLLERSLGLFESARTENHLEIAGVLNDLGNVYTRMVRFDEAEASLMRALDIQDSLADPDQTAIGKGLRMLGNLYMRQGRADEAETVHLRGIPIDEEAVGNDHPDFAESLASLGRVYYSQGRNEDAERLYLRAVGILERALGPEHPDIGVIAENIGNLYNHMRRYDEAEVYLLRGLALREKALAPDHPFLSYSLMNIAALYTNSDRLDEAERHLIRAIAIQEKVFEAEDYRLALSRSNLSEIYMKRGRLEEAERFGLAALAAMEKSLAPDHIYNGFAASVLAKVYVGKADNEKAQQYYERVVSIFGKRPADDPNRIELTTEYIAFLRNNSQNDRADELEAALNE